MEEFINNLQFCDDDILSSIELDFPNFDVLGGVFGEETHLTDTAEQIPSSSNSHYCVTSKPTVTEKTTSSSTNLSASYVDQSRFPVLSEDDITHLQASAENANTKRSTIYWMKVLATWCKSRDVTVKIETLEPADLNTLLNQFYAEVKKVDGEDYEPESLKIMQAAIDRYLKQMNYKHSITRSREFANSQKTLQAKALSLRMQGKGKRPNKSCPLTGEEEEKLWSSGQLGDHNGRTLTQVNFKNLTEQMGFRGRQDHYDAYIEDFQFINHEDGSESIKFTENPTKTRSGGLSIRRRTTPQVMSSTDGGERDPVRLFKLWLSKRPEGMKDNGPLYLQVINRPKNPNIWYGKIRMGQNTIGNIMKSMASSCLSTTKRITNHSMRKTLVQKLKKSGQPRHIIKEITGHARESSLDDYDEVDEEQRKELSHIISGFPVQSTSVSSTCTTTTSQSPNAPNTNKALLPVQIIQPRVLPSNNSFRPMIPYGNQDVLQSVPMFRMNDQASSSKHKVNYNNCTITVYSSAKKASPTVSPTPRKRRYVIYDSDDEKEN
ncbi:hypothetical protein QZH41_006644 [Actinostola sp. cb2023]|nr:hypothetical protein QZH41_006644 [Actinostola sp. cb2023]